MAQRAVVGLASQVATWDSDTSRGALIRGRRGCAIHAIRTSCVVDRKTPPSCRTMPEIRIFCHIAPFRVSSPFLRGLGLAGAKDGCVASGFREVSAKIWVQRGARSIRSQTPAIRVRCQVGTRPPTLIFGREMSTASMAARSTVNGSIGIEFRTLPFPLLASVVCALSFIVTLIK